MNPQPYNKKAMVRGMERRIDKAQEDNRQMYEIFKNGKPPMGVDDHIYGHYMKDEVSKISGSQFIRSY
jgi:hypothetical protein